MTETKSCMFLRAEDTSKTRVFLSIDDQLPLIVYVENSPALETRSYEFSVYKRS